MRVIGTGSVFPEETLTVLPIGYRFMVQVDPLTFRENYQDQRLSQSTRHQSKAYQSVGPGKPVSHIVVQDYLAPSSHEH